jgi:hypothetical protein
MTDKKHGYPVVKWEAAKAEAVSAMSERAKVRGMIPYSELASKITAISFDAHDKVFHDLLGEASVEEDEAGRGLISVVVVHKIRNMQPGPGFLKLAKERGRNTNDIVHCWVEELHKVHAFWSNQKKA